MLRAVRRRPRTSCARPRRCRAATSRSPASSRATTSSASVYSSMDRALVHSTTFKQNQLAMVAGLATLSVIDDEGLVEHAHKMGDVWKERFAPLLERYELLVDVRGKGQMVGLEFGEPQSRRLRRWWRLTERIRPAYFAQTIVLPLFQRHRILTQVAADGVNIIKLLPSLAIGEEEIDLVVAAFDDVLADAHRPGGLLFETTTALARGSVRRRPEAARRGRRPVSGAIERGDRVVVTGAAGFIGSAVTRALLARGASVTAVIEPGADTADEALERRRRGRGRRRGRAGRSRRGTRGRTVLRPHRGALRLLAEGPRALLLDQRRGQPPRRRRGVARRRRARLLHVVGRHDRAAAHLAGRRGGRGRLRPRRAPLRQLQAVEVRGRARGAPPRRPGRPRRAHPADVPGRTRRPTADPDGQAGARLPQREVPRLRGHDAQRRARRRPRRGPRARARARPAGDELHPRRRQPGAPRDARAARASSRGCGRRRCACLPRSRSSRRG